jgi:hypothetical protein
LLPLLQLPNLSLLLNLSLKKSQENFLKNLLKLKFLKSKKCLQKDPKKNLQKDLQRDLWAHA